MAPCAAAAFRNDRLAPRFPARRSPRSAGARRDDCALPLHPVVQRDISAAPSALMARANRPCPSPRVHALTSEDRE
jgi:hypothetical protein